MRVSVCIPTYNRPNLLKEAIDSCLAQTYLPWEIIVGDDSKDQLTQYMLDHYVGQHPEIKMVYLKNEPSLGQLANVNRLIEKASGDKFVLLHDDDLLVSDALELMVNCFKAQAGVQVVYGKQVLIKEDGTEDTAGTETLNKLFLRTDNLGGSVLSPIEAAIVQQFPNDAYMIDMEAVKKVRYGSKSEVGNAGDFDFGLRLALAGYQFYFVPKITAKYRVTMSSVARNGTDSGYQSFKLISKLDYAKSSAVDYKKQVLERKAPIAILQALKAGRTKDALAIYFGKWHRSKIFTIGGVYRFSEIIRSYIQ